MARKEMDAQSPEAARCDPDRVRWGPKEVDDMRRADCRIGPNPMDRRGAPSR
jgi:hypothetical protein